MHSRQSSEQRVPDFLQAKVIGARLLALREVHNLKSSEIAGLLGIERTYWSRWERGHRTIPLDIAFRLTKCFEVDLDFVFAGDLRAVPPRLAAKLNLPVTQKG